MAAAISNRPSNQGADLVIGANTIVEATRPRTDMLRLNWALSRVKVEPVTEQAAKAAAGPLQRPENR